MGLLIRWDYLECSTEGGKGKYRKKIKSHRMIKWKGLTYFMWVQKENGKENIWRESDRFF